MKVADFAAEGVDVAIRLSKAIRPIFMPKSCPTIPCCRCAAPRLVEQGLRSAADLPRFPLIHYDIPTSMRAPPIWADWFAVAGLQGDATRGLKVNVADHALDAAVAGAGVSLSFKLIASDDVHAGRLVCAVRARTAASFRLLLRLPQGAREAPERARVPRLAVCRDGGDEGEVGGSCRWKSRRRIRAREAASCRDLRNIGFAR